MNNIRRLVRAPETFTTRVQDKSPVILSGADAINRAPTFK